MAVPRLATPLAQLQGYVGPAQPLGHRAAGGVGEAEVQGAGTRLGTIAESGWILQWYNVVPPQ